MGSNEIIYFKLLKEQVVAVFVRDNAVNSENCNDWSGQEIELFQEDFRQKVKSSFSEKWFYTYFKNEAKKLPRIDMLNLLSEYAGYQNFADFKDKNKPQEVNSNTKTETHQKEWLKHKIIFIAMGAIMLLGIAYVVFGFNFSQPNSFSFCFVEKSTQQPPKTPLRITLLLENESPLEFITNTNACFEYTTEASQIKFVVQSPFHEPDTIVRNIKKVSNETISLRSNDYALMLQYYTSANIKDWKRKRERLERLIADNSIIYRVYPQNGIAIYNKKEFINQLTIPTEELKKIQILEIEYKQNQIVKLKYTLSE